MVRRDFLITEVNEMSSQEKQIFYNEVESLVDYLKIYSKDVRKNQDAFAEKLNKSGVKLFFNKEKSRAKAFFWVAHLLGSPHAYGNLISAAM